MASHPVGCIVARVNVRAGPPPGSVPTVPPREQRDLGDRQPKARRLGHNGRYRQVVHGHPRSLRHRRHERVFVCRPFTEPVILLPGGHVFHAALPHSVPSGNASILH
jgi:hypothetical protein